MQDFFDFMDKSVSAFHAVKESETILKKNGFKELKEEEAWDLSAGTKFYVKRNSSSLMAFKLPKKTPSGFRIFAAHTDSPAFRVKENAEVVFNDKLVRLNIEKYGGMILSTWLDRPLSVAGRLYVKDKTKGIKEVLVNIDKDLLVIPNVAIHFNRDINDGYKYSVQNDMLPVLSDGKGKGGFLSLLAGNAGVKEADILSYDLFLYPRQKAGFFGANDEFIVSPRLDDLSCVYSGLKGITGSKAPKDQVSVLSLFDNEEVGSGTKQGADSTFLYDVLKRIAFYYSEKEEDFLRMVADSFAVSADNGHAVHPAAQGKSDITNRPYLNDGIVLKYNGNQRYATDAYSAAYFKKICDDNGIAHTSYANNSDVAGGSTLGNISTSHVSVKTVDIGLPQYAMHSAVETAGTEDLKGMIAFATAYYNA